MYVQNYNEPDKLNQWTLLRGITEYLNFDYEKKWAVVNKEYNDFIETHPKLLELAKLAEEYKKLHYLLGHSFFWKKSKINTQLAKLDKKALELTKEDLNHNNFWKFEIQASSYYYNYAEECHVRLSNKIYADIFKSLKAEKPNINEHIIQAKLELLGESAKDYTLKELVKLITEDKKY